MNVKWLWVSVITGIAFLGVTGHVFSQEELDKTNFVRMKLKAKKGAAVLSEDNPKVEYLQGEVDVLLIAKDPAENVRILADRIDFVYEAEEEVEEAERRKGPTSLNISGGIQVESQGSHLRSDKAVVDLVTQVVRCEGHARATDKDGNLYEAEWFTYDLNTEHLDVHAPALEIEF